MFPQDAQLLLETSERIVNIFVHQYFLASADAANFPTSNIGGVAVSKQQTQQSSALIFFNE